MIIDEYLVLCTSLLIGGLWINQVSTQSCTPLDEEHTCYPLTGRNTPDKYPQVLPGNVYFSESSIASGFLFLRVPPPDPNCETAFQHVICLAATPPCNNVTDLLLPVCSDSCSAFNRLVEEGKCDSILQSSKIFLMSTGASVDKFSLELLTEFNCNNVSTYYFSSDSLIDAERCTDLLTPQQTDSILSNPNQCVPTPSTSICNSTTISQYTHYIPLRSRSTTTYQQLLGEVAASDNFDQNCTDILLSLGCYITFPPCDPETGNALPLCLEACEVEYASIQFCLSMVTSVNELTIMMSLFNCSDANSYLPDFVLVSSSLCINSSKLPETAIFEIVAVSVIAGAIVGSGVFLILGVGLLFFVLVVFVRKRSQRNKVSRKQGGSQRMYKKENFSPSHNAENKLFTGTEDIQLSDADRLSYEKVFSSILVPYTALTVGEVIGQGAFGKVFRGEMRKLDSSKVEDIAIKTIKNLSSKDQLESFFAESLMMKDFSHPNILRLAGVCFDTLDGVPYILLPFMANGSLKDFLKTKRTHVTNVDILPKDLNVSTLVRMCMEVANGMEYLAEEKFVHRDLAARNCMVDNNLVVKVGDFGLARDIYSSDYYRANEGAKIPVKWMAPETLHDAISNEKTDVWSFGVTCWEVFSLGRGPYPGIRNQDILKHISTENRRLKRPSLCPKMLYELLMTPCWKLLPEERPPFSQLVEQLQEHWEENHAYIIENTDTPSNN
ncbi:receptor tyrosine-protein kinase erbB-2-like isoform X2 [Halichondria panicea]|uniref:receptor tyrosine-protein kinase erbB-2-like isoform X2 n=1 Tax=Halichondria panicea TaxID=6063 RepID=UPI00312B354F